MQFNLDNDENITKKYNLPLKMLLNNMNCKYKRLSFKIIYVCISYTLMVINFKCCFILNNLNKSFTVYLSENIPYIQETP